MGESAGAREIRTTLAAASGQRISRRGVQQATVSGRQARNIARANANTRTRSGRNPTTRGRNPPAPARRTRGR